MKKQILFVALLLLAVFVNTNTVFGQALLPGITATQALPPLSCAANANFLHPIAGVPYIYQMNGAVQNAEPVSQWTWFATKNPEFINATGLNMTNMLTEAAGQLLEVSDNYGQAGTENSVTITWTPEILTNTLYQGSPSTTVFPSPTFVVGYGTGECADNIKVYEINPILNFTIDIANIDPVANTTMAWDADAAQCVADVASATYTGGNLDVNYGVNTLYFEVAAANFVNDFTPTFRLISGLAGTQTAVVTLHASLANAQTDAGVLATANWTAASVGTDWNVGEQFTATNATDVANGVSLFVKVVITNDTYESLTDNVFALAVDAQDNNQTGIWDLEDEDCDGTPTDEPDQVDFAEHTINPRPTITGANVPDANAVAPNDIIPVNP